MNKKQKQEEKEEILLKGEPTEEAGEAGLDLITSTEKKSVKEELIAEEEKKTIRVEKQEIDIESWNPKTALGKKVKSGEITSLQPILESGQQILESQIVDVLAPNLGNDLLLIGQSKGKFGGGQRRVFRQTQKKTMEGNKPKFSAMAIVGNQGGLIGIGYGKSKETVPAREKSFRNAKLNLIQVRRGCGSWQCDCKTPHSVPFRVRGKCGSSIVTLLPAPKGTGLVVGSELKKMLSIAGIKDVWSRNEGKSSTRVNVIVACFEALKQTKTMKIRADQEALLGTGKE